VIPAFQNILQVRAHQAPKLGQLDMFVTAEQLAAKLRFELLDGAGEGRLGHVAALGGAMEIECVADRQKVSDLGYFHGVRS
jgi:hypothetical protein